MLAGGSVGGLILAAGIRIEAAAEGDEIGEELQGDELHERREPFRCFRNQKNLIGGDIVIRRRRRDHNANHFPVRVCINKP